MLASNLVNTRARRGAAVAGENLRKQLEKAAIAGEKLEAQLAEEEKWPITTTTLGGLVHSAGEWHVAKFLPSVDSKKRARAAENAVVELDDDDDEPPFNLVRLKLQGVWHATAIADSIDPDALVEEEEEPIDPAQALFAAIDYVEAGERDADDDPRAAEAALMLDDPVVMTK